MNNKYLPIGTICTINNDTKVMIAGYKTTDYQNNFKICDYVAIEYPTGLSSTNSKFIFNHEDIKLVIYKGYEDENFVNFNEKLNNSLNDKKENIDVEIDLNKKSIAKYQFDENGIVISINKNNIQESLTVEDNTEETKLQFEKNETVINKRDNNSSINIELTSTNKYQFDEFGIVTSVNNVY